MPSIISRGEFFGRFLKRSLVESRESVFPSLLPQVSFSSRATGPAGDILICIFQRGGMDGISAVVPVGDGANYYDKRPNTNVPEAQVLSLDGQFGLNPALVKFKEFYDAGKLAIVQATGSIDPSRSHFDAERIMEQATPENKSLGTGWIARHLESELQPNDSPFRAVGISDILQASLRGTGIVSALALESISSFRLRGRGDQLAKIDANLRQLYKIDAPTDLLGKQGKLVFDTIDILKKIGETKYTPANGAVYPKNRFGRALTQVAQLI